MSSNLVSRLPLDQLLARLRPLLLVMPGLLKVFAAGVVLINIRGWPFAWHFRIYLLAWSVRLRFLFVRIGLLLKSKEARRKAEDEWLEHLSPVGSNPFEWRRSFKTWAGPDDSDFNLHLSNSSYAKNLDMSRFSGSLSLNPTLYRVGGWVALGATHFKYLREIPMLSVYEMRSSIATWDSKWLYVITRYVTKPKEKDLKKQRTVSPEQAPTPLTTDAPIPNLHTPATPGLVRDPADTPLKRLLAAAELLEEPDDATLHCIAISECCFKIGRITIPPSLVLAVEGFTAPPAITELGKGVKFEPYSHANPPPHWEKVRALRTAHDLRPLQTFMKGGWKKVPEDQRWWDLALKGVEGKRRANLELIDGIHQGMEGAKYVRPILVDGVRRRGSWQ
ncbi:unnamed protein product [Somion occarium]|uniref:Uncharacterized protein n=1 Tax=Somion occarium TaxID=3059160 RepID=A0ABP1CPD1_9APHY